MLFFLFQQCDLTTKKTYIKKENNVYLSSKTTHIPVEKYP